MIEYREVEFDDKNRWDELAPHPMQSWAWGEFRSKRQPINRLGVYENGILKRGYLVVWTKLPKLPYCFGYVPMSEMPDKQDLAQIIKVGKQRRALGVRFEPVTQKGGVSNFEYRIPNLYRSRGLFKPKTYLWDLTLSEDELLRRMHQKARYNIKVAAKHGVMIREDNSPAAVANYCQLLLGETAKRQRIGLHDPEYHRQMIETLGKTARLFIAKYKGEVISTMLVFVWKETAYYAYGGNSLEHKEVMAPTLLVWEVAKIMKAEGKLLFDLWGAEEGKGFSRFKQQFGADLVDLPGAYDLPVYRSGYWLFRLAEEVRWKIRHR